MRLAAPRRRRRHRLARRPWRHHHDAGLRADRERAVAERRNGVRILHRAGDRRRRVARDAEQLVGALIDDEDRSVARVDEPGRFVERRQSARGYHLRAAVEGGRAVSDAEPARQRRRKVERLLPRGLVRRQLVAQRLALQDRGGQIAREGEKPRELQATGERVRGARLLDFEGVEPIEREIELICRFRLARLRQQRGRCRRRRGRLRAHERRGRG